MYIVVLVLVKTASNSLLIWYTRVKRRVYLVIKCQRVFNMLWEKKILCFWETEISLISTTLRLFETWPPGIWQVYILYWSLEFLFKNQCVIVCKLWSWKVYTVIICYIRMYFMYVCVCVFGFKLNVLIWHPCLLHNDFIKCVLFNDLYCTFTK